MASPTRPSTSDDAATARVSATLHRGIRALDTRLCAGGPEANDLSLCWVSRLRLDGSSSGRPSEPNALRALYVPPEVQDLSSSANECTAVFTAGMWLRSQVEGESELELRTFQTKTPDYRTVRDWLANERKGTAPVPDEAYPGLGRAADLLEQMTAKTPEVRRHLGTVREALHTLRGTLLPPPPTGSWPNGFDAGGARRRRVLLWTRLGVAFLVAVGFFLWVTLSRRHDASDSAEPTLHREGHEKAPWSGTAGPAPREAAPVSPPPVKPLDYGPKPTPPTPPTPTATPPSLVVIPDPPKPPPERRSVRLWTVPGEDARSAESEILLERQVNVLTLRGLDDLRAARLRLQVEAGHSVTIWMWRLHERLLQGVDAVPRDPKSAKELREAFVLEGDAEPPPGEFSYRAVDLVADADKPKSIELQSALAPGEEDAALGPPASTPSPGGKASEGRLVALLRFFMLSDATANSKPIVLHIYLAPKSGS